MASQFHNASTSELADEYGSIKGQVDAFEKRLSELKAEMIARQVDRVEGPRFTLTISTQISKRLDTKALKDALGAEICAEYERETESTVIRIKPTVIFGQQIDAE